MRVISGKFKYKLLYNPKDNRVRPTTDRIKETLFNIVASKGKTGSVFVLDLFAGSGALGIESLSRGASKVVFIDKDKDSFALVNQNLKHVGAQLGEYETYNVDYEFALKKLKGKNFDLIFIDPPYALHIENAVLELIKKYNVLAKDGLIVIEHDAKNEFRDDDFVSDTRKCGSMSLTFLEYKGEDD
jgi:16S rRNA (guanine(966)-N(2))-methyltransferase RsmD